MGRPAFKIDQVRLRALRREKGFTQTKLARKVAEQLGQPFTESHERHYQRIEKNGKTSIGYANALATVLGVSAALLQGDADPEPSNYLQHIKDLLRKQLDAGASHALQEMFNHLARDNTEQALEYLTEDVAELIEQVLLVRNPTRIAELTQLTGLSEAELIAPANVRGFWFLSVYSHVTNYSEVVNAAVAVGWRIGEIMREYLGELASDSTVRMWRDQPWLRIEITRPRIRDQMRIDFTRCQPDATGLRWIEAGWRDEFTLLPTIVSYAYQVADVVTDFSDKTVPADLHRLRWLVTEHDGTYVTELRSMVVRGAIDAIPDRLKESFAKECSSRFLFVSWLKTGLRDALMPHLAAHPASRWHVSTSAGATVDIKLRDPRDFGDSFAQLRYRITLVEEIAPRSFHRAPVRETDLNGLRKDIEQWLEAGHVPVDDADPIPDFEPI